ncbi:MAG: DUF4397 domain-containing protein [Gammaproteobacteria bacterium]
MKKTSIARILPVLLTLGVVGCSHSGSNSDDTVKPTLVAFNAVSDMPDVTFLRVEEVWSSITYGVGTSARPVDPDTYNLHFDALLPGDQTTSCQGDINKDGIKDLTECTRVATKSVNLLNGHEYTAALIGQFATPDVTIYDNTAHVFSTTSNSGTGDTDMQVQFFNWSNKLGTFDVYLEAPGTNLSVTQVKATLAPGQAFTGLVQQGTYVLTLTPVGQPDSPIYLSQNFDVTERTRVGFAILDGTNESTSNVKVSRFRDQGGDLFDRRTQTLFRMSHVAPATSNVDVYQQENYTTPLFANVALKQTTDYTLIDPANLSPLELDITPAGNVGVLLEREQLTLSNGSLSTLFFVNGANNTLNGLLTVDTARRIAPYAQVRLVNTLTQTLDFYVIPHDNNVYTSTVTAALSASSIGGAQEFAPGDYDVILMRSGTSTIVFGPLEVHMAGSGLYTVVGVPTADVTRADILLLGDFQN